MNQYICRVCKGNECTVLTSQGPPNCGCLHNSDIGALWEQDSSYKSEREKVLELLRLKYVEFLNHPCPELADKYKHCCDADWCGLCTLDEVLAELRQKAGEQCGDNCKGECSGEVTGTPFCPQSEQYCLWIEDEDGVYQTSCLHSFQFINGTPETNGIQYCPYCGNLIRQAGEP